MTGRHEATNIKEIFWVRETNPNDNKNWDSPVTIFAGNPTTGGEIVDAHENIQLPGNEVYVILRTALYQNYSSVKPEHFYGMHYSKGCANNKNRTTNRS